MIIHILAEVLLLGLLLIVQASGQVPGCAEYCGDIVVPFPFGIGPDCFLGEWYEIDCRNGSALPVPVLKKTNLEVLGISLEENAPSDSNIIKVKYPVISNASCAGNGTGVPLSLKGSPFSFFDSSLTVVGCNVHALITSSEREEYGCKSGCGQYDSLSLDGTCLPDSRCCQIGIPPSLQEFKVDFREGGGGDCSYAVIWDAYPLWSQSSENIFARKPLPVKLSWGIGENTSLAAILSSTAYADYEGGVRAGHICYNLSVLGIISCFCDDGYLGNPYLEGGCILDCTNFNPRCSLDCHFCNYGRKKWTKPVTGILAAPPRLFYSSARTDSIQEVLRRCTLTDCPTRMFAIGSALGGILLLLFVWWQYKFIKRWRERNLKQKNFKRNGGLLLQQQLNSPEGCIEKSKIFTSKELEISTENFNRSRILGHGGQGTVYKDMLTDGRIVAIKRSTTVDDGNLDQFINEVVILSLINHRNIVNLLGCCLETEVPLLIYEFIPNGTLYQLLHEPNEEVPITWETRLRIGTETAGALAYLHSAASMPIYHRDIKSSNILLDEKFRAKIADFGTSKPVSLDQTHVTTLVRGTLGYLDPEYFQSNQFTEKSDVYSFGVLLVELLTGQKPISSSCKREGTSLATYFIVSMEDNRLFEILDPEIIKNGKGEGIWRVALLAKRCLGLNSRNRPSMKEVAAELEEVRNITFPSFVLQNQGSSISAVTQYHDFPANWSDADSGETEPLVNEHLLSVTTSW